MSWNWWSRASICFCIRASWPCCSSVEASRASVRVLRVAALETTEVEVNTFGAGATEDIYQWTTNNFLEPTLLPDFQLQPIVKLFQPHFMSRQRVTRLDGTAINHKRILSWLMPRYAILTGRCGASARRGSACG